MLLKHKTIAQHMVDVLLNQTGSRAIMYGDAQLLNEVALRCTHTNLMDVPSMKRQARILGALEHSSLFVKEYVRVPGGQGNQCRRVFYVAKPCPTCQGTGVRTVPRTDGVVNITCLTCGATGKVRYDRE